MSRTGAFGEKITDTLNIVLINETQLNADITYYDLDDLDPEGTETPHNPVEAYQKRFVAVAKVSTFDPYQPGATDDTTGPAGYCEEVEFEND